MTLKQKPARWLNYALFLSLTLAGLAQDKLRIESPGFQGVIHDNLSNQKRQGSGLSPLMLSEFPKASLYREDAVGINFEHIFNGAKAEYNLSMFTPRKDTCRLETLGRHRVALGWPSEGSSWGVEAQMSYDFSHQNQIDLHFEATPTRPLFSQNYLAMMWASYMNRAIDRRIHFWGQEGDQTGWVTFGEGEGEKIETGTVAHIDVPSLPFQTGAQTLNLIENPEKKFILPFYYGFLDGDHDLETKDDRLLYLVLFDQTESIRFAMWNFARNASNQPDTHSPAWDWQYVIRDPVINHPYGYRARIVIKPYQGRKQIAQEYDQWRIDLKKTLPPLPRQATGQP